MPGCVRVAPSGRNERCGNQDLRCHVTAIPQPVRCLPISIPVVPQRDPRNSHDARESQSAQVHCLRVPGWCGHRAGGGQSACGCRHAVPGCHVGRCPAHGPESPDRNGPRDGISGGCLPGRGGSAPECNRAGRPPDRPKRAGRTGGTLRPQTERRRAPGAGPGHGGFRPWSKRGCPWHPPTRILRSFSKASNPAVAC